MDINAKHPTPHFQNIMLLDLPVEVLENIAGKCDSNSLRQLYTTCRQLRLLAFTNVYTVRDDAFRCRACFAKEGTPGLYI